MYGDIREMATYIFELTISLEYEPALDQKLIFGCKSDNENTPWYVKFPVRNEIDIIYFLTTSIEFKALIWRVFRVLQWYHWLVTFLPFAPI